MPDMSKSTRTYLLSILMAMAIVLTFAVAQIVFVLKTFRPEMIVVPLLMGGVIGLLLGKVQTLRSNLAERNRLFSALSDFAFEFTYFRKVTGEYEYVSPACKLLTGYSQEDFYRKPNFMDTLIYRDDEKVWRGHIHNINGEGVAEKVEFRIRTKDGQVRWIEHLCSTALDDKGQTIGVRSTNLDITERKKSEVELSLAAKVFESPQAMIITDTQSVIIRSNQSFRDCSGYSASELLGQTPRLFKSGRHDDTFYREMWDTLEHTGEWQGEIWDRRKNGEVYPKWLIISAIKGNDGAVSHYLGTHFDITERKIAEQKIQTLAFFDQLTGLPNRTLLMDRLKQAMTVSARNGTYCALLFIDLDNFKTLNDTLGHDRGDLLLQQVAERLKSCVRADDSVARLGGDEFVVMLTGLSSITSDASLQTEVIGGKILTELNHLYQLKDTTYHSTPSIGATLFKNHEATIDDLLKQADLAMYKAKDAGRNTLRFFDPEMESTVLKRVAFEAELRGALDKKQFLLHFQAQVESGEVLGAEALVRWQHPIRGMVSPAEFIPLAEETGLILSLGAWVLETACAQLAIWAKRAEMAHLTISVNVSSRQFMAAGFVNQVLEILAATKANPQRLKLELTESLLVSDVDEVIEKMYMLKAKGVGFSLDDFGTGYSSLTYLKRLPLDQLKIDQSFVRDILSNPNDASIAKTIISLAHNLRMGVIAEGVETSAQQHFLATLGCHTYQGYLYSKPLPIEEFDIFVGQYIAADRDYSI